MPISEHFIILHQIWLVMTQTGISGTICTFKLLWVHFRPVASSFKLVRPGSGCGNKMGVSVGVDKMLINKYMLIKNYNTWNTC